MRRCTARKRAAAISSARTWHPRLRAAPASRRRSESESALSLDRARQRRDAAVFGRVEARLIVEPVLDQRSRVVAPENLAADAKRRHAEHAGCDRGFGVRAEHRLDVLARDGRGDVLDAEYASDLGERFGIVARAAILPEVLENSRD